MGVRKAAEAATATAIRKGSGETLRLSAMAMPTGGAATMTVALLLMTSESVMVTTIEDGEHGPDRQPLGQPRKRVRDQRRWPPEVSSAAPSGIIEPSSTITGQATWS